MNSVEQGPVFVISTGRSGSTLVQRILNCHPDLVVWGEHFGFLGGFATAYAQMLKPEQCVYPRTAASNSGPSVLLPTLSNPAAPIEWSNPYSAEEFRDQVRRFIENYFCGRLLPNQRWGFKEIRYNSREMLGLLLDVFPTANFVFIRRNLIQVARSKILAFIKEQRWSVLDEATQKERIVSILAETRRHYGLYKHFTQAHPDRAVVIDYESLQADPRTVISQLIDKLGLEPGRFNWSLADEVMRTVVTATRRDEKLVALIRQIDSGGTQIATAKRHD